MGNKIENLSLSDCAVLRAYEDMKILAKKPDLKKEMIDYLDSLLHENDKAYIRDLIAKDPDEWSTRAKSSHPFHMSGGTVVRNLLRDGGFTEGSLGIVNLDNVYVNLLEAVIKRI